MLKEKILPSILISRNSEEEIYTNAEKQKIKKEELESFLKNNNLDKLVDREQLVWRLQHTLEKVVFNYHNESNGDLAEKLVNTWNEKEPIKLNKNSARHFIDSVSLQLDSRKRAFVSLSNEDTQSCLIYLRKDFQPIVEWLVRFGLLITKKELDIIDICKVVLGKHFPNVNAKAEVFSCFRQFGFSYSQSKGDRIKFDFKRMRQYKETFSPDELLFSRGIAKLILDEIREQDSQPFTYFKEAILTLLDVENAPNEIENTSELLNRTNAKEEKNSSNRIQINQENDIASDLFRTEKENTDFFLEPMVVSSNDIKKDVESISTRILEYITEAEKDKKTIEELDKENKRFSHQIEEYEKKQKEVSFEKFISFIKLLGGKEGNYALHELFDESNGNSNDQSSLQTQGHLISLFSSMQLFGVEPYLSSYQLGDEITLKKADIGQQFTVKSSIMSENEEVTIKVTGYGWTLDGKILVQPLVEQVITK